MEQLYISTITNFKNLTEYDLRNEDDESGCPSGLTAAISMLYLLVKYNQELLKIQVNGKVLHDHLFEFSRDFLIQHYRDYCWDENKDENEYTMDLFIHDWMQKEEDYDEYYYSNGAYNLDGVTEIQLQRLLLLSKPNEMM
jgi:hypothetical protein